MGLYIQDHVKLQNGLSVTAGLRRSWLENESRNNLDSATTG